MTLPEKKRGFRSIVVNEQTFYWKVDSYLDIRSGIFPETKIHVALEWVDSRIPVGERSYLNNLTITPRLVSESILFALNNEWNPAIKTEEVFSIRYEKNVFSRIIY